MRLNKSENLLNWKVLRKKFLQEILFHKNESYNSQYNELLQKDQKSKSSFKSITQ